MSGPTAAQQREGVAAIRSALAAFSVPLLYLLILGSAWYADDEGSGSGLYSLVSFGAGFLWMWAGFGSISLAIAGIVYGFSSRRTQSGRWGFALSCLYFVLLVGWYFRYFIR